MRHNVLGRKLNHDFNQRKALFRSLISNLVINGKITTTIAKGKSVIRLIDKLITKVKRGDLAGRRLVLKEIPDKDIVDKLYQKIRPALAGRTSGFTRMTKLSKRHGDRAQMVVIEWTMIIKDKEPEVDKKELEKNKLTVKKA